MSALPLRNGGLGRALIAATVPAVLFAAGLNAALAQAPDFEWVRQFGTSELDVAETIALDATSVYAGGWTNGTFPGETSAGWDDAFLQRYDPAGILLWTRQFGSSQGGDRVTDVVVDTTGVYVAGWAGGAFPGETYAGGIDAFLRKYDADGNVLWTRQFGTPEGDLTYDTIAVDGTGVYVAGVTYGTFPGETNAGDWDAFLRKYDADGNVLWTREFGTPGSETTWSLAVDTTGVYVAGYTDGTFPGETYAGGDADAFLRKYDGDGNVLWTRQFGTPEVDGPGAVAVDVTGVYVDGWTHGTFPGETSAGGYDGFLGKLSPTPARTVRFDLHPDTLNLRSRGRWVTAYVATEDGGARDIDQRSMALNGVPVSWTRVLDDATLMAKFDRAAFARTVQPGDAVVVTLTGEWRDGSSFTATDTIRVIRAGR